MTLLIGFIAIAVFSAFAAQVCHELKTIAKHLDDIRLAHQQLALYAGEELKVSSGVATLQKYRA